MAYEIVVIQANGNITKERQLKAPDYKQISKVVGGLIQQVPHLTKIENMELKRGQMMVNEEGILHNLPYNPVATAIWRENLGKGPFSYESKLYGTAIYWAKVK